MSLPHSMYWSCIDSLILKGEEQKLCHTSPQTLGSNPVEALTAGFHHSLLAQNQ